MSLKASVKAFSSGGGEVSVGDVTWLGFREVSATGFDGVSGFGGEAGLGCSVTAAALAGGGGGRGREWGVGRGPSSISLRLLGLGLVREVGCCCFLQGG